MQIYREEYVYKDTDILTVARAVCRICIVDIVVKFTKEELFTLLTFIAEASDISLRILRLHFYNGDQFFYLKSDHKWRELLAKVKLLDQVSFLIKSIFTLGHENIIFYIRPKRNTQRIELLKLALVSKKYSPLSLILL